MTTPDHLSLARANVLRLEHELSIAQGRVLVLQGREILQQRETLVEQRKRLTEEEHSAFPLGRFNRTLTR